MPLFAVTVVVISFGVVVIVTALRTLLRGHGTLTMSSTSAAVAAAATLSAATTIACVSAGGWSSRSRSSGDRSRLASSARCAALGWLSRPSLLGLLLRLELAFEGVQVWFCLARNFLSNELARRKGVEFAGTLRISGHGRVLLRLVLGLSGQQCGAGLDNLVIVPAASCEGAVAEPVCVHWDEGRITKQANEFQKSFVVRLAHDLERAILQLRTKFGALLGNPLGGVGMRCPSALLWNKTILGNNLEEVGAIHKGAGGSGAGTKKACPQTAQPRRDNILALAEPHDILGGGPRGLTLQVQRNQSFTSCSGNFFQLIGHETGNFAASRRARRCWWELAFGSHCRTKGELTWSSEDNGVRGYKEKNIDSPGPYTAIRRRNGF